MNTNTEATKVTMETLADTTAQRILVATYRYFDGTRKGWQAETYRLTEAPILGWGKDARAVSECALSLEAASDEYFEDNGSAIAWAMNN